jgi:hypothetical protein
MSNIDEKAKNNLTIEMRIFDNQDHGFWHWVIKPWFQPERFGITHLWFPPYKKYIPHRIKVLKLVLKDLERIKEEYGKDY